MGAGSAQGSPLPRHPAFPVIPMLIGMTKKQGRGDYDWG